MLFRKQEKFVQLLSNQEANDNFIFSVRFLGDIFGFSLMGLISGSDIQ